jgi:hypothetical protein
MILKAYYPINVAATKKPAKSGHFSEFSYEALAKVFPPPLTGGGEGEGEVAIM